jgi:hypothetical protein
MKDNFYFWLQFLVKGFHAENTRKQIMKAALNGNVSALIAAADVANVHDFSSLSAVHFLPLHSAICGTSIHRSEHLVAQTIHALMRFHVDVNVQDTAGETPLHKAMQVKDVVLQVFTNSPSFRRFHRAIPLCL